ncbi:hypothetical protein DFH06DRAFT_1224953 [Mycena polygramma]|nr:hypothetical protein DFH06DRAFT_1224953 [Mycena polygramma]
MPDGTARNRFGLVRGAVAQQEPNPGEFRPPLRDTAYPILTLLTEITVEIFVRCLPDEPSGPRTYTAPLLLGRICRTWRNISLSTPELWSFLRVTLRDDLEDPPVEFVEANWPLTLVMDCFESSGHGIKLLKQHSHMWHDVMLVLRFDQFSFLGPDLHLPLLQRLAIAVVDHPVEVASPVTVFRKAPALRHLHVQDSVLPVNTELPWAQLTSFESDAHDAVECMDVLRCTPNLVHCVLNIQYFVDPEELGDVPPLMFLASLGISSRWRDILYILQHLFVSVPVLQSLDVSHVAIPMDYYLPPLHRFLCRPECRLRTLSMQLKEVDERIVDEVIILLQTQPTLEKLDLHDTSLEVLTAICHRLSDGSGFLPSARDVSASVNIVLLQQMIGDFSAMLDGLVAALSVRWMTNIKIHNCTITYIRRELDYLVRVRRETSVSGAHM